MVHSHTARVDAFIPVFLPSPVLKFPFLLVQVIYTVQNTVPTRRDTMETKGKRVRRTAMLLLWSAICAAGGTAVGHGIAPTVLEADRRSQSVHPGSGPDSGGIHVEVRVHEHQLFGDGVMAMTPIGGEAVMGSTDGVLDSGSLTVLKIRRRRPPVRRQVHGIPRGRGAAAPISPPIAQGRPKLLLGAGSYRISEMATDADTVPAQDYEFTITKGQQLQSHLLLPQSWAPSPSTQRRARRVERTATPAPRLRGPRPFPARWI